MRIKYLDIMYFETVSRKIEFLSNEKYSCEKQLKNCKELSNESLWDT
ncbi:MAG: hypothetical protein ACLSHN_10895 [Eubacterium sp.]